MAKYDRMDSIFEGFENRVAIGDLEDAVKDKIVKGVIDEFGRQGGIVKAVNDGIGTIYFDIDTLEVEQDGESIEDIAVYGGTTPDVIAAWITDLLKKIPAKDRGHYESASEAEVSTEEPKRVYLKVGKEFTNTKQFVKKMERAIDLMKWYNVADKPSVGLMPGEAIKGVIQELKLPGVDKFGISNVMAPMGFYAIQANYKNGEVKKIVLYVLDKGHEVLPIAVDEYRKLKTQQQ